MVILLLLQCAVKVIALILTLTLNSNHGGWIIIFSHYIKNICSYLIYVFFSSLRGYYPVLKEDIMHP